MVTRLRATASEATAPIGVVTSHLEAVQLDAAGHPCNVTPSTDRTDTIGVTPHHYNIPYTVPTVPVLANCGSRTFIVRISLQFVSGNTVKIDGSSSDPNQPEAMTDAFIINEHYAPSAVTVPPVTGLSQAAAQAALTAAHLIVGTVTSVVNPAPPGTVIAQNASAGTVEPVNSRVDLTVSLGLLTVPNVVGWDAVAAENLIRSLGLAVAASSTNNCIDPNTVQTQEPAAGSIVAPGLTVHLSVSTCNSGGGGGGLPK